MYAMSINVAGSGFEGPGRTSRLEDISSTFVHLDEERHYECKVSCPRTQHGALAEARTRTAQSDWYPAH